MNTSWSLLCRVHEQRHLQFARVRDRRALEVGFRILLERPPVPLLRGERSAVALRVHLHARGKIRNRNVRDCHLEQLRPAKDRVQRDEPAVAPAHDAEAVQIRPWHVLGEIVVGANAILDFLPAVVDRVVVLASVAGAAAVLRSDHDVPARHERAHLRNVQRLEIAVHAAMDHDDGGMLSRRVARHEQIRRDDHVICAGVQHLAHEHLAAELQLEIDVAVSLEQHLLRVVVDAGFGADHPALPGSVAAGTARGEQECTCKSERFRSCGTEIRQSRHEERRRLSRAVGRQLKGVYRRRHSRALALASRAVLSRGEKATDL